MGIPHFFLSYYLCTRFQNDNGKDNGKIIKTGYYESNRNDGDGGLRHRLARIG